MTADRVSVAAASILTGINMTSLTNACVSGSLTYTTQNGQMFVLLADVRALARASGIKTK